MIAGKPYMVGENGPEMFTPNASGSISNNPGGYVINNNFGNITLANGKDEQRFEGMLNKVMADTIRNLSLGIR